MKISNIIRTFKTYTNPLLFYAVCYRLLPMRSTTMSLNNGLKFHIRPHKGDLVVLNELFFTKDYDIALKRLQPKTSVVVDIGGHIGTFSIKASLHSKQVVAYEPDHESAAVLRENVRLNERKNVRIIPFGIARKQGRYQIFISEDNPQCNSMYKVFSEGKTHTQLIKCKNFEDEMLRLKLKNIDLLKVDCEGAEFEILMSLSKKTYNKINAIIVEYHETHEHEYGHKDLFDIFHNNGFKVQTVNKINSSVGLLYATKSNILKNIKFINQKNEKS